MSTETATNAARELNRLFAEEMEAANRYLHLMTALSGLERISVEPILREAYEETVQHALTIGRKLRALGVVPELRLSVECPPEPVSGREALEIALTFEQAALEAYQDLLMRVEGDVLLEEFVRAQVALESEHVSELKQLLS